MHKSRFSTNQLKIVGYTPSYRVFQNFKSKVLELPYEVLKALNSNPHIQQFPTSIRYTKTKWHESTNRSPILIPYNLSSIPLSASTDSIASNIIMFTNSLVQQNSWQKMHRTTKMQTWAFFPLVKQQYITKTTSNN